RSSTDPNICKSLLFFFQVEDGIRDRNVTGVQTCALPISKGSWRSPASRRSGPPLGWTSSAARSHAPKELHWLYSTCPAPAAKKRSEERRVGKECRQRWMRDNG